MISFRQMLAAIFLLIVSVGCVDTSQMGRVAIAPPKRIIFLLIDNSLSYNNPEDIGSQRVMDLVKHEIVGILRNARPGDHYIVRTIQSESNQLTAMITNLNLTQDEYHFLEPKPTNPIELKVWERDKRDFEANVGQKMQSSIDAACSEFEARGAPMFAVPSNQTDFVGALLTCQRFFEKQNYDEKKLIIYSDMIEDAALEDESLLDLPDVSVEARFVTKPAGGSAGGTHQYFKRLEASWLMKLNAADFELYEVQNSF